MNMMKSIAALMLALALIAGGSLTFAQSRMADIEDAKRLLNENPNANNRLRLGTLQYLEGVDYLQAGDVQNAIEQMQAAVWTFEDAKGEISETTTEFEEARYGLSYALLTANKPYEAMLVLDQLVQGSPNFDKARYLLGVTLLNIPGKDNQQRSVDVMAQLASDGNPPYMEMAERAATRMAYNLSTIPHAQGDAAGALDTIGLATNTVGRDKGENDEENTKVAFAMGVYFSDTGDVFGALDEFETAYSMNPNYQLSNGVALAGVLSNTYYQAGLDQISLGGETAALGAVDLFDESLRVGDPQAKDALHGKAVAQTVAGDSAGAVDTLKELIKLDPSYYEKIKK